MLHAIVSDIHGNLEALDAVLADIDRQRPGSMVCLGDFVGYGASPNECIDRLRPRIEHAVVGNHDAAACAPDGIEGFNRAAAAAARWTGAALTPENRAYLAGLPYTVRWRGTLLVHASPRNPEDWHYVLSVADARDELAACSEPVCWIGHSHYPGQFIATGEEIGYSRAAEVTLAPGHRYLITVPSVGQPRDGDPRAGYLLYDEAARTVRHVRVTYDIEGAMNRILAAGLPPFLAERLKLGE